ncbi:MAG TPA: hypothetical protein VNW54_02800 [Granulicella sp.]|jgi:hypothetical protein|nr:hypothetical protein [Granulicella sp.]
MKLSPVARIPAAPPLNLSLSLAALLLFSGCARHTPSASDLYNQQAALPSGLPAAVLQSRVITSSVDRQRHTMSTLTGNDLAVDSARAAASSPYPAGSVLTLATWEQRDDPHWFGARIPATPKTVETVTVTRGANAQLTANYQVFAGSPLRPLTQVDAAQSATRRDYILAQHASVMP